MKNQEKIFVIGHKNPDTDSICSAIAYANLKNQVEGNGYEAYRAGNINGETRYVLDTFGIKDPKYVSDVRPRLTDVNLMENIWKNGQEFPFMEMLSLPSRIHILPVPLLITPTAVRLFPESSQLML